MRDCDFAQNSPLDLEAAGVICRGLVGRRIGEPRRSWIAKAYVIRVQPLCKHSFLFVSLLALLLQSVSLPAEPMAVRGIRKGPSTVFLCYAHLMARCLRQVIKPRPCRETG